MGDCHKEHQQGQVTVTQVRVVTTQNVKWMMRRGLLFQVQKIIIVIMEDIQEDTLCLQSLYWRKNPPESHSMVCKRVSKRARAQFINYKDYT